MSNNIILNSKNLSEKQEKIKIFIEKHGYKKTERIIKMAKCLNISIDYMLGLNEQEVNLLLG